MKITAKSTLLSVGAISLAFLLSSCGEYGRHPHPPHHKHDCHQKKGDKRPMHNKSQFFEKMDKNSDGKITKSEFSDKKSEHFNKIDTNNDGVITKDEMKDFHHDKKKDKKCRK
jgi:hypothetical protein